MGLYDVKCYFERLVTVACLLCGSRGINVFLNLVVVDPGLKNCRGVVGPKSSTERGT